LTSTLALAGPGAGAAPGRLKASFRVTISSSDLATFLTDPAHPAAADGTVWVDGYTRPEGEPVVGGQFNLFTEADGLYRRHMLYCLPFHDPGGRHYVLRGRKEVWDHGRFDVWGSTTTLYASLLDAADEQLPALASGVLKLNLPMFAQQLSTMRITGTGSQYAQLRWLSSVGQFFTGTLFDVFVRARLDV
jgi:cholesterol oxidase